MKLFSRAFISPWTILAAVLGLTLISWSPTAPDYVVNIGTTNTTNGFSDSTTNITTYRGLVSGTGNKVGSGATSYSIVTGSNNTANAQSSVIAGTYNSIARTATDDTTSLRYSGIFGNYNTIPNSKTNLLVCGYSNTANASESISVGAVNTLQGPINGVCNYSATIGLGNSVSATSAWAIGWGNAASGTNSTAIGVGTRANATNGSALGRYNNTMATDDVLAIGNGTSDTSRSTALRVTANGSVILGRAQGDIAMGDYQ